MSNKMNKPQGNGSKMISKLANKMNPAIKRPLQVSFHPPFSYLQLI